LYEDIDAEIFDANGDGLNDLFVVSGGNEGHRPAQDRLYLNRDRGELILAPEWVPLFESNGSTVSTVDMDKDGDIDLFIGGASVPGSYPLADQSHILINQGNRFTKYQDPEGFISKLGIVKDSRWADMDGNEWPDLVLAGHWMPIMIIYNEDGALAELYKVPFSDGWWNTLEIADLNNDGDFDIVGGNFGLNSEYRADVKKPVTISAKDFDNNGTLDPIICRYFDDVSYPVATRDALLAQVPTLQGRIPKYSLYAHAKLSEIFKEDEMENTYTLSIFELASGIYENLGKEFKFKKLPLTAQYGPVKSIRCLDIDGDGCDEIIIAGNDWGIEVLSGQQDALPGTVFGRKPDGDFCVKRQFNAENARNIEVLCYKNQSFWLIAQNDMDLKIIRK
jgi:hypothetical protein